MPNFSQRSTEPELMDQGGIPFEEFHHCLRSLEVINHLTLAYRPTLNWLKPWLRQEKPLTILDAGSGGGDMLRKIDLEVRRSGSHPDQVSRHQLIGVDLHPWSKKSAELSTFGDPAQSLRKIRYETQDIFRFEPETPIDLIICSLFTHHLTDDQVVDFLRWIDSRATRGWFINDLHRHPVPYHFIRLSTGALSNNRLIRNDAAVSVARSFTKADWHHLLAKAGIRTPVRVQWYFPFRICISSEKPDVNAA